MITAHAFTPDAFAAMAAFAKSWRRELKGVDRPGCPARFRKTIQVYPKEVDAPRLSD
jgi:hypothetical protein